MWWLTVQTTKQPSSFNLDLRTPNSTVLFTIKKKTKPNTPSVELPLTPAGERPASPWWLPVWPAGRDCGCSAPCSPGCPATPAVWRRPWAWRWQSWQSGREVGGEKREREREVDDWSIEGEMIDDEFKVEEVDEPKPSWWRWRTGSPRRRCRGPSAAWRLSACGSWSSYSWKETESLVVVFLHIFQRNQHGGALPQQKFRTE